MICYQQDSSGAVPAVSAVPAAATVLAVPEVQHNPETLPTADAADAADAAGALLGAGIPLSRGRALSEGELTLTSARTQCAQLQLGPVDVRVADAGQQQLPGDRGFQRQSHVHEPAHCGLVLFQIGELFQSIDGADVVAQGDPESMPQVFIVSRHSGLRFEQGADVVEVRV